ncbi:hypothetical protein [Burkholderia ubonensis]|uniref:hypothetical protein n=1 Tax=Burkholderia ubonensis TaxID=101571 RepID=UPI0007182754|nr:hypothetical protein [Burkholderia ubonensis]KWK80779.1 hypothetical protein WM15_23115 [Burkholderia ubonensis]
MSEVIQPIDPASLSRKQKLAIIYRHTHRDFKGPAGPAWGVHAGEKTLMINENGGSVLTLLETLSDEQIADKLPYALKKEAERRAKKGAQ